METKSRAGNAQALLLLLGSCLPVLGAVLIAPVLPRMQAHFADVAGAEVLVPIVLTIPALMIALLAPVAGMIADRLGRMPVLLVSMLIYGVCGLLPFWLESLPAIVASRAGLGVAEAGIMTCCTTLMGDYFSGTRRHRLFALQMVATSLSAAVFIALGGALGQGNWRLPFALYGAGFLFLPLMALLLWEPARHESQPVTGREGRFPWRALLPLYALTFFAGISLFIVPVQAGYLLNQLQVESPRDIGLVMGANQLGVLVGALAFRLLSGFRGTALLALAFTIAGAGGLMMALADSLFPVSIAVLVNGLGVGLLLPVLITQVMARVDFALRGRATGGFTASLFAGEFASPLVVMALSGQGALFPTVGLTTGLTSALGAVALVQLLIAAICLMLYRPAATPAMVPD